MSDEKFHDRWHKSSLAGGAALLIAAIATLALVGCGSDSAGESELTVYVSAPRGGPGAADARDVADGARLALDDGGGEAGGVAVRLVVLDDPVRASDPESARAGANARTATEDSTAIAYIGELDSGSTRTSLPITNEAGLLQVSAAASAVDLTRAAPGSDQVPDDVQPSGSRTFGRVVPSDPAQGAAAAAAMNVAGIERVGVVGPDSDYLDALVDGFESVSGAPERVSGLPLDALYQPTASVRGERVAGSASIAPEHIFGADAVIAGNPPRASLPAGATVISGTLAPSQLAGSGGRFRSDFRRAYDRDPGRFAAYGYEAMALVLDSIDRAEDPLDRGSVVEALFATADRESILGVYSIDDAGDTTLPRVGAYEVRDGGILEPSPAPLTVP